jgi:ATP-dependent DNA helicase RecQ
MEVQDMQLQEALQANFGFDSFKGNQEAIIKSVLEGKDTFVIMPTGGGKSLCYQLPAIISEGTAIIISPLIALMKNQVDQVRGYSNQDNIAHFLNSSLNKNQIRQVRDDITERKTKMLYVAPETLKKEENIAFFQQIQISFVAIDEAHCISEWGHDFRPEYRHIKTMINAIGDHIPLVALTATATPKVQSDIIKNLNMTDPEVFMSSFNRDNLYYEVRPKPDKAEIQREITRFIKDRSGKSGIIYCLNRKTTEEIAALLNVNGIKAAPYHAGLEAARRASIQDDFLMEEIDVICATIAFGMGIDKPDVRFVIHYDIPKSIENYYQETGRAGRDGLEGDCVAFYSHKDILKLEKFMRDKPVAEREMGSQLLMEMVAYSETGTCRRKFLLHYFGEQYDEGRCSGRCDNCRYPKESLEVTAELKMAMKAILDIGENQGIPHIVDVLTGKVSRSIMAAGHESLPAFGSGKEKDERFWNSVIRQGLMLGLLHKGIENYGLIRLNPEGHQFLKKSFPVKISLNHDFKSMAAQAETDRAGEKNVVDPVLLDLLGNLRRKVAREKKLPPYIIFQDTSLEDMATQYPISMEELTNITGVSQGKANRYGKPFVELIADYVEENDIDRPNDFVMKSVAKKGGNKIYIIQNIDKKISLEDIAQSKGMTMQELIDELDSIVSSGTRINLDYYLDAILDEYQQEDALEFFRSMEMDDIEAAYDELKEEGMTLEEVKLMRIKFFSEMGN